MEEHAAKLDPPLADISAVGGNAVHSTKPANLSDHPTRDVRVVSSAVADEWHPQTGPHGLLPMTAYQARLVLGAEDGWPTYDAGLDFQGLAMSAMSKTPKGECLPEIPTALNLIWGALTDEMDAPGRGSPEQDASAVRHMKQAAADWLRVMDLPEDRSAYLDRWIHDECGYERQE